MRYWTMIFCLALIVTIDIYAGLSLSEILIPLCIGVFGGIIGNIIGTWRTRKVNR